MHAALLTILGTWVTLHVCLYYVYLLYASVYVDMCYVCRPRCRQIYVCVYVCMYVCMYVYVRVCVCVYEYLYVSKYVTLYELMNARM